MIRLSIALVLASLVGAAAAAQTTYRCTDARGKTSYGDHGCTGQAGSPMQARGKLESDCAQGSRSACAELRQSRKRSSPAAGGKADSRKSQRKQSAN